MKTEIDVLCDDIVEFLRGNQMEIEMDDIYKHTSIQPSKQPLNGSQNSAYRSA